MMDQGGPCDLRSEEQSLQPSDHDQYLCASGCYEMNLYPCAYSMTFNDAEGGRGQADIEYHFKPAFPGCTGSEQLECGPVCGIGSHVGTGLRHERGRAGACHCPDAHIYDRHVDAVKELICREPFPAPEVLAEPEIKDFYQFTPDDEAEGYQTGEQIKDIPIAI